MLLLMMINALDKFILRFSLCRFQGVCWYHQRHNANEQSMHWILNDNVSLSHSLNQLKMELIYYLIRRILNRKPTTRLSDVCMCAMQHACLMWFPFTIPSNSMAVTGDNESYSLTLCLSFPFLFSLLLMILITCNAHVHQTDTIFIE